MSPFVVITAIPFGYLVFYLGLLALFLGGVAGLVVALWHQPRRPWVALTGALGAVFALAVFGINVEADAALDLNPSIPSDSALLGTWRSRHATLTLSPDGSYHCSAQAACGRLGVTGRWQRSEEFDVRLVGAQDSVLYRVVRYRGILRLTEEMEDPDMWDGRFLFEHVALSNRDDG